MTVPPPASRYRRVGAISIGLVALVVAACAGVAAPTGITVTPASSAGSASRSPATAGDTPSPIAPASPQTTAASAPPAAVLGGVDGGPVAGDLGSFSWDGLVSDSPWIVERAGHSAAPGTRLRVAFEDSPDQAAWTARWAPVRRRQAGTPRSAGSGRDERITIEAPNEAGPWSLQLQATFGDGRRAVWYWRVDVDG